MHCDAAKALLVALSPMQMTCYYVKLSFYLLSMCIVHHVQNKLNLDIIFLASIEQLSRSPA